MGKARAVRGATLNAASTRFNLPQAEADGDWLDARDAVDGERPRLRTTVTVEQPRTIVTRNASPDVPFDRSINAYRGCEHGPRLLTNPAIKREAASLSASGSLNPTMPRVKRRRTPAHSDDGASRNQPRPCRGSSRPKSPAREQRLRQLERS